jgi:hypothetical protein
VKYYTTPGVIIPKLRGLRQKSIFSLKLVFEYCIPHLSLASLQPLPYLQQTRVIDNVKEKGYIRLIKLNSFVEFSLTHLV